MREFGQVAMGRLVKRASVPLLEEIVVHPAVVVVYFNLSDESADSLQPIFFGIFLRYKACDGRCLWGWASELCYRFVLVTRSWGFSLTRFSFTVSRFGGDGLG